MLKRDYFIKAVNGEAPLERDWVLSAFSITSFPYMEESEPTYPFQLFQTKDNRLVYYDENETSLVEIEDAKPTEQLFNYKDNIILKEGELLNVDEETKTIYGNVIVNAILLVYPFKDKIAFIKGKIDGDKIVQYIADNLKDTPKEGEKRDDKFFYVDELEVFANAASYIESFNFTCVPTTSEKTMVPNPEVIKLRDELLKKHRHELDNPAVIADIQAQMAKLDKEYFKDDPASGFYLGAKAFNITRMKKFGMMGLIGGIGDVKPSLVPTSLAEGWDKDNINSYIDDIRAGSYARGKSTAISGYGVKLVYNAFQSVTITEDDCKQTKGLDINVTKSNYGNIVNRYTTKGVLITEEIAREHIGKTITVRTPMLCKTKPPSFCAMCVGKSISRLRNSVHITASDINSIYMNITMKSMHGKSLATAKYTIVQDN